MSDIIYRRDVVKRQTFFTLWEKQRCSRSIHWFVECLAEALGVFVYCYAGVGSTAAFILGGHLKEETLGSLLQVGFAYAFGILFAIVVFASTSGGHFNPCITVAFVAFKGFPKLKALRYILAQIIGGYMAIMLVYIQYKDIITPIEAGLKKAGAYDKIQFTPQGPAGILAIYMMPHAHLTRVVINEFVTDTFIAMVIWACIDPSNMLCPPQAAPWIISFAYSVAIWGYAPAGLAANTARDVGGRLVAITIYGKAATGGIYAIFAAITNIPATLFGAFLYEIFFTDSDRVLSPAHLEYMNSHKYHLRSGHHEIEHTHNNVQKSHQETIENAHHHV